ncbi:MAG TPA: thioredoxin, partial [Rhodobacteraceae bacterium]|nr:thioredoxin [Paracoccaceae bacterium]
QVRVITALRAANPAYDNAITFVRVDWDDYSREDITTSRNIPRRSTLVLLRGDQELGRIVADTRSAQIQALMDLGL